MAFIELLHEKKYNIMNEVHVHQWHELYYLKQGKTRYLVDDELYPVDEGSLVFIDGYIEGRCEQTVRPRASLLEYISRIALAGEKVYQQCYGNNEEYSACEP